METIFAASSRDDATGDIIIKFVNTRPTAQQVHIVLKGVAAITGATGTVVTGNPTDVNTVAEPTKVSAQPLAINNPSADFTQEFPRYSASVLRLKMK